MHTARHLVERCLQGNTLRGRTVILVTHHISLCLSAASYIVELANGEVIREGTIKQLQATGELKTVIDAEDDIEDAVEVAEPTDTLENEADNHTAAPSKSNEPTSQGKLVEAEHRAEGRVSLQTYFTYVRAAGWISWIFTLSLMLMMRLINIVNDVRLASLLSLYLAPP